MALIQCPECNKEVSDQSKTCPHCGFQLKGMSYDDKKKAGKLAGKVFLVVLAIAIFVGIYDACTVSHKEALANLRKSTEERHRIQEQLNEVREQQAITSFLIDLLD